jgi:tetratricopeptide (TPR) repeat protein
VARIGEAQALSRLGRHGEAAVAHLQNGRLGLALGLTNALAEFRAAQDFPGLLATADEILAQKPRHPEALVYRGEALAKLGRWEEAEPALNTAVEVDPKATMAWADLSCCLVERQAFREAVQAADKALALDPTHLEALYNRGRARFGLRQYREGRDDMAAALASGRADSALADSLRQSIGQAERYLAHQEKSPKKPTR